MSPSKYCGFLLVLSMLSLAARATNNEVIGFVKHAQGDATVTTDLQPLKAKPGTPLYLGSVLKTGDGGSLGVTFRDNTMMSFGPDTEVTIDEYLYQPAKGRLKLAASLVRGTLHYISGVIAKLKPEAVSINTSTGIIGVRGTRFAVKAEN